MKIKCAIKNENLNPHHPQWCETISGLVIDFIVSNTLNLCWTEKKLRKLVLKSFGCALNMCGSWIPLYFTFLRKKKSKIPSSLSGFCSLSSVQCVIFCCFLVLLCVSFIFIEKKRIKKIEWERENKIDPNRVPMSIFMRF